MYKGIDLYNKLTPHLGEPYLLGALVPKNAANWKGNWDCAEFGAWGVYQLTGKLYGCANDNGNPASADAYTGFMASDAARLGTKITVEEAARTPGAFILRVAGEGITGHLVISDGHGGTVEAHSHKDGVIKSVVSGRRWDYGILVPWITYEANPVIPVVQPTGKIYRYIAGNVMIDPIIGQIQAKLAALGYYKMKVDNQYGRGTFEAVRAFQSRQGLNPDGEVGPKTAAALGIKI